MRTEEPVVVRHSLQQNVRVPNQIQTRMSPGQNSGKASHSPGTWKNYITTESNLRSPTRKQNQTNQSNQSNPNVQSWNQLSQRQSKLGRLGGGYQEQVHQAGNKLEDQRRRKQQMMRRVEQIEKRVNPILKSHRNSEQIDENFGWNNKMEQRILKLQTNIDMIQKQMQIKIQRRLLQVQRQWNQKFNALVHYYSNDHHNQMNRTNSQARLQRKYNGYQHRTEQSDISQSGKESEHTDKNHRPYKMGEEERQNQEIESTEGYFTRRELEKQGNTQRRNENGSKMKPNGPGNKGEQKNNWHSKTRPIARD